MTTSTGTGVYLPTGTGVVEVYVVVLDGGPFRLRRLRKPEIDENRFLQIFLSDRSIYLFFFWFQGVVGGPNIVPGRQVNLDDFVKVKSSFVKFRLRDPTIYYMDRYYF